MKGQAIFTGAALRKAQNLSQLSVPVEGDRLTKEEEKAEVVAKGERWSWLSMHELVYVSGGAVA